MVGPGRGPTNINLNFVERSFVYEVMVFPFLPAINGIEVKTDNVQRYSNALCCGIAVDVFLNAFNIFERVQTGCPHVAANS